VIAFLLALHRLGAGTMGDPIIKCVQDSVITILVGLQHNSVAVRANCENLLAHARDRTRDIFSVRGAQKAARCLQFLRHHAEIQFHKGKQQLPAPCQVFRYQPGQIFSQNDFLIEIQAMLKATKFQYQKSQFGRHILMTASYTLQQTQTPLYDKHMVHMGMGAEVYRKYPSLPW